MRSPFFWPAIASLAIHGAILCPRWGWRQPQLKLPSGTRSLRLHLVASPYLRAAPRHIVKHRQNPETPRERPTRLRRDTMPPLPRRAQHPVASPLRPAVREVSFRRPTVDAAARPPAEMDVETAKRQLYPAEAVPQLSPRELLPPRQTTPPEQPVAEKPSPAPSRDANSDGRQSANSYPVDSDLGERGVRATRAAVASCVPEYPRLSRIRGEEGTVVLEVAVRADGTVANVRVVRSSGYRRLDRAGVEAMKKATFSPALRGSRPAPDTVRVAITFKLRDRAPGQ